MSTDENKALAMRAFEEVWNKGNLAVVDEIYLQKFVDQQHHRPDSAKPIKGTETFKEFATELLKAFPDHNATIQDQIAEGDKVVIRYKSIATHRGKIWGVESTNKQVTWTGIVIYRIESGKIAEVWVNWDLLGLLQQIGAISTPVK
ncbi:MAG: ester cyclase [Candidatus Dadabacteria bacterium]|nr:ester cyclase [Candidatus Dadabacteria bacterium]